MDGPSADRPRLDAAARSPQPLVVRLNDDTTHAWQWFATMSVAPNGRDDVSPDCNANGIPDECDAGVPCL